MQPARPRSYSLGTIQGISEEFEIKLDLRPPPGTTRPRSLSFERPKPPIELGYSPSSTGRLIAAIDGPNRVELCQKLASSADEFPPVELAVLIACILQQPFLADKKELVANLLLLLARKFSSMQSCSKESWNVLADLLLQGSPQTELAKFLRDGYPSVEVEVDVDFPNVIWDKLAQAFNTPHLLHELGIRQVLITSAIRAWINSPCPAVATVHSLLFLGVMCSAVRPKTCDFGVLAKDNACQEFVLQALTQITSGETSYRFLESFNAVFEGESWALLAQLSSRSLRFVDAILMKSNDTVQEPAFCLQILNNPNENISFKLSVISRAVRQMPMCDIAFLYPLVQRLKHENKNSCISAVIQEIVRTIRSKPWNSSCIVFTYETSTLNNGCLGNAGDFLVDMVDLMGATPILEVYQKELYRTIKKFILALIRNLDTFANANRAALVKISPRALKDRLECSFDIKFSIIGLLFELYNAVSDEDIKSELYNTLKVVLRYILVSENESEPCVQEAVDEAKQPCLYISRNGSTRVISLPN